MECLIFILNSPAVPIFTRTNFRYKTTGSVQLLLHIPFMFLQPSVKLTELSPIPNINGFGVTRRYHLVLASHIPNTAILPRNLQYRYFSRPNLSSIVISKAQSRNIDDFRGVSGKYCTIRV